jgi:hypothetical protein
LAVSPRDRRALLFGGGVMLGAVILLRAVPWAGRSVLALRTRASDATATLVRARAVLDGVPALRDSLPPTLNGIVALAPQVLDGRTRAEAEAALSDLVSLAARRHALLVVRVDPVPDSGGRVLGRATLHAEVEGDVAGLTQFLRAIETGEPVLTVPALSVQALETEGRAGGAERLRIEATVSGFYLPTGAR